MSTFGLIIPGRPIETNFQQVDSNKFLVTIPNADSINHIVLFLTGVVELPLNIACCIFFSLPDPNKPPTWHYLGYLNNTKPSAIYRLTNLTQTKPWDGNSMNPGAAPAFDYPQAPVVNVAQIGISAEPVTDVAHMVPVTDASALTSNSFTEFTTKTVKNLFNYCSSFSRPLSELIQSSPFQMNNSNTLYVPLSTLQSWFENYTRRLSNDRDFWKSLN